MADPRYNTAEHKGLRRRFAADIKAGRGWCREPVCLMPTRHIAPDTPWWGWHVPHNEDGVTYRGGPAHSKCNTSEGARRRHATPPPPTPPRRWAL